MAKKNLIQFQAGMSLPAFLESYGSEEQCRQALFEHRWPQGFICPACGHARHCHLRSRDLFQCNRCKHQMSLTRGTLFVSVR